MRHLLTDQDLTKEEILQLFDDTIRMKQQREHGKSFKLLEGKKLAMIFEKPSLRTRTSFEVGMFELGGLASFLNTQDLQLGRGETVADTARVLGGYYDVIMARVYEHKTLQILAEYSGVPVINGLSDKFHPCQALTDIFTLWERGLALEKITIAYVGDGNNNVTNSLILICARLGIKLRIACPEAYSPNEGIMSLALNDTSGTKFPIKIMRNIQKAVKNADVIYTDTWVSMGDEEEKKERIKTLLPFQVNENLLSLAKDDALIMHCLPAHRENEITNQVMDGPNSVVFDQSENRLHVQKAILIKLLR